MIHVDNGRPEHLGRLVRALLPEHPDLDVFTDVRAVLHVEPGSVLILVPKPDDAEWLNLNRPIFAQRQLRVILYCDHATTLALVDRAADFLDWVSQHHTCPDAPPAFAVEGLRKAVAANAPGIVWTGSSVEGLVRVLGAAFPGETLEWVLPAGHYYDLARRILPTGDAWVAYRPHVTEHVYQFRRALAVVGKRPRAIMMIAKHRALAWWPVNDTCLTLDASQSLFLEAGMRHPGRLAALTGLEKETVELARQLINGGVNEIEVLSILCGESDPGIALAKKAHGMKHVDLSAVALRIAPAPLLRALDDSPEVIALRETFIQAIKRVWHQWNKEKDLSAVELFGVAPSNDTYRWMRWRDWKYFLQEWNAPKNSLNKLDSRQLSSSNPKRNQASTSTLELSKENIAALCKGKYVDVSNALAKHKHGKRGLYRQYISEVRARIYLDLLENQRAKDILRAAIPRKGELGPSAPRFAELMVDLALLLHREGDASTAFALLRKLLGSEWVSLHMDASEVAEALAKPTNSTSVNDFVHLFLAQSNTPPALPPESSARALRILAEVLLSQGRYEEVEDVAQRAHETALHAHEIARAESWRAIALLGRARALQGRYAEGKQDLERAIELATSAFGATHAEVARLWLHLARIFVLYQDSNTPETIRKTIDVWQHAECEAKERDEALEELRRLLG